jgi:hypothetical protein
MPEVWNDGIHARGDHDGHTVVLMRTDNIARGIEAHLPQLKAESKEPVHGTRQTTNALLTARAYVHEAVLMLEELLRERTVGVETIRRQRAEIEKLREEVAAERIAHRTLVADLRGLQERMAVILQKETPQR